MPGLSTPSTPAPRAPRGRWLRAGAAVVLGAAGWVALAASAPARASGSPSCLWHPSATADPARAAVSAQQVVERMTLPEKISFLGLAPVPSQRIEEENPGVPLLCVPSLLLRDGPVGVAGGATGVTAFPSELSLAATFDPSLALQYGTALGREARAQGTMGIQGPGIDVSVFDNWGRGFENLGSDPTLTSTLGAAMVEGIQRTGEFAMAKHLGAYVQESGRTGVDVTVSPRADQEIYLAPFRAAAAAGVASVMCAMGSTDGIGNCEDPDSVDELRASGFDGLVRTDAGASSDEVASLEDGVDLFRPFDPAPVEDAVADGTLPVAVLNRAVREVLTVMFRYDDVTDPVPDDPSRFVSTSDSVSTSLSVAERSMVLLKNDGVLPLGTLRRESIAVIGAAAAASPIVAGGGSSMVNDTALTTDLAGIVPLGAPQAVTYTPATPTDATALALGPASGDPVLPGYQEAPLALPASATGLVDFSYAARVPTQLDVDGSVLLENPTTSTTSPTSFEQATELSPGGHEATLVWPDGVPAPTVTAAPVDGVVQQAAAAARQADVAIVDVGEQDSEGVDRPTLALPGYENQLVAAVAAANPRTIVVVHSGGPVLMPWLGSVAAVLEAWYPGQVAGDALGAVLAGAVDPSGRLPVSFPTTDAAAPLIDPDATWPASPPSADLVALGDLGVGARWDEANGVTPLFPFGFGLTYSSFALGPMTATVAGSAVHVALPVTNTGRRTGRYVALVDVTDPPGSGEPPNELRAFGGVTIAPHHTATLSLTIPVASLEVFEDTWQLLPGTYTLSIGAERATVALDVAAARAGGR